MTLDIGRSVYGADVTQVSDTDKTVCYDGFDEAAVKRFSIFYTGSETGGAYALDDISAENYEIEINNNGLYTKDSIENDLAVPYLHR